MDSGCKVRGCRDTSEDIASSSSLVSDAVCGRGHAMTVRIVIVIKRAAPGQGRARDEMVGDFENGSWGGREDVED